MNRAFHVARKQNDAIMMIQPDRAALIRCFLFSHCYAKPRDAIFWEKPKKPEQRKRRIEPQR